MPLTLDEVRERLEYIRRTAKDRMDYESAHAAQDDLYQAVLEDVAAGCKNGQELAREALKADKIDFPRWCA